MSTINLSGALNGLCKPCLGHCAKLSTKGCKILTTTRTIFKGDTSTNSDYLGYESDFTTIMPHSLNLRYKRLQERGGCEPAFISFWFTSATLMKDSPFRGSGMVFHVEDPVQLPCTGKEKNHDIVSLTHPHELLIPFLITIALHCT